MIKGKKELGTIMNFVSLIASIILTLIFIGTLFFALSSGVILKNITNLILLAFVGICSITSLVVSIVKVVKEEYLVK